MNAQTQTKTDLTTLPADVQAMIAGLQAKANATASRSLSFKVTAKKPDGKGTDGAVSVYGLGQYPTTLYAGQWERLLDRKDDLLAFIKANEAMISRK